MIMAKVRVLNAHIDNLTMQEAVGAVKELISQPGETYAVTPNLDHIVILDRDREFVKAYKSAALVLADGMPIIWISRLLKRPIKEKISGSDLFPQICAMCAEEGFSIFILGAAEGVAERAAHNLCFKYKGLHIAGTYSPPLGFERDEQELGRIREYVTRTKPDVLAVALGSPKGEKFLYQHQKEYGVPFGISIGATIDFEAGVVKRAPKWMADRGLEWLYRITQDPKRMLKRYMNDAIRIIPIFFKYR